ncbi:leukotriene B4 receptor 1-like [Pseudonaja textilis]|uniref:leukotriene B4 receptor 1-like n=1 Tax=Pseudonaja textilis TaxID=8673 RepID=UPI000EAAAF33|nr:leukotriene B4 receptor 1-like [Pseudonaja textilis]
MTLLYVTGTPTNQTTEALKDKVIPTMFLTMCFLIGAPGNGLVIWTILSKFPQRSFTIALILNLAVADLLVILTVPFWTYYFVKDWVFGNFMCWFLMYLVCLTVYTSIFSITLMSLHRFAVVVLPFASQRWRKPREVYGIMLAVWLLAGLLSCPYLIFSYKKMPEGKCTDEFYDSDNQQLVFNIVETLFAFVIPFAVLAVCYTYVARKIRTLKNHKEMKTGKLIAAVVGAFFVCWLPYHILNLITISALLLRHAKPEVSQKLLESIKTLANIQATVAFVSSCINPILYAFAARSFRGGLRETNFAKLFEKLRNDTEEKVTKANTVSMQTL